MIKSFAMERNSRKTLIVSPELHSKLMMMKYEFKEKGLIEVGPGQPGRVEQVVDYLVKNHKREE